MNLSGQVRTVWATDSKGKTPFHVAVQILSCDDQHDNHQEAPKKKEEGKDGLADPEDLQKGLK